MTFQEYYKDIYLPLHTKTMTKVMHMLGIIATVLFVTLCIVTTNWIYLPLAPLVVYPFAWSSHFIWERNKPAAWSSPLYAKMADLKMFYEIMIGKI